MALKRWSYLLISAWLINALVCFHSANFFESISTFKPQCSSFFRENTLVDVVFNYVSSDNNAAKQHHKVIHRNRYIGNPTLSINIQLPLTQTFNCSDLAKTISYTYNQFWENKFFLPPLHDFLFRLRKS